MRQNFSSSEYLKSIVEQKITANRKDQTQTIWHWGLLILFALLTYAGLSQQFLLILVLIGLTAIVKGPLMFLWGSIYSALIAFFPPLALLLSFIYFVLNIGSVAKNWRTTLVGLFFYLYPLIARLSQLLLKIDSRWFIFLVIMIGMMSVHFLLKWLYRQNVNSRYLLGTIVSMPHTLFILFLPQKIRGRKKLKRLKQ